MLSAALGIACAAHAGDKPSAYEASAGFDAAPQSLYWYTEGVAALSGDISKDGFLLRNYSSIADYQYNNPLSAVGEVNGRFYQFDLMAGYQVVRSGATFGGYVGFDYQDAQLSPNDPTSRVNGTRTGVKVEAHFDYEDEKQPLTASLIGEYASDYDTYYTELRLGLRVCKKLIVGPAVEADGDTGYNGQRLGGFATYTLDIAKDVPLGVTLASGHQFVDGTGGSNTVTGFAGTSGTYGTIELDSTF